MSMSKHDCCCGGNCRPDTAQQKREAARSCVETIQLREEMGHRQRPQSMPVGTLPSSTGGMTVGVASHTGGLQSPDDAPQVLERPVGFGFLDRDLP